MLITLHVQSNLPDDEFGRNLAASKISEALTDQLQEQLRDSPQPKIDFLDIAKSPAFFAVHSGFALNEYLKNSNDAGATQLDFYVIVDGKTITSVIIDNGKGITEVSLSEALKKENKLVNYLETQLKSEDGKEKQHIQSSKRSVKRAKGGEGLGLAIVSRVLRTGTGTLEIGNADNLPGELRQKANMDADSNQHGAVLVATSPLHSDELEQKYEAVKSRTMQDSNHRYLNYCMAVEADFEGSHTPLFPLSTDSDSLFRSEESALFSPESTSKMLSILSPTSGTKFSLNLKGLKYDECLEDELEISTTLEFSKLTTFVETDPKAEEDDELEKIETDSSIRL